MKAPVRLTNVLPEDLYGRLINLVKTAPLYYGAKSNSRTDPYGHLSWKPFHDKTDNLADIGQLVSEDTLRQVWLSVAGRREVRDFIGGSPRLLRYYVNAYTYGMDGYFHRDSERIGEVTVILFLCEKWFPDWAGECVCMTDDWEGYWFLPPKRNAAVMLPSNMLHCGRAVSRKCPEARTVLVMKMRPQRNVPFEMLSSWLVQRGALKLDHKDGTLHDHLVRVFTALECKGLPLSVCLGGGLHSIYGTNVFTKQLVAADEKSRAQVRAAFGFEAENLSFMFHSLADRPAWLEKICIDPQLTYLQSHLCLIEAANLADQGSLDKWPNLRRLWNDQSTFSTGLPAGRN